MRPMIQDMENVLNNEVTDKELQELVEAVRKYAAKREMSNVDTQKHVDFLILFSAILDIPEESFEMIINSLNIIRLKRLGIVVPVMRKGEVH